MLKHITLLLLLFALATSESVGQSYVQGGWLWQSPSTSATVATAFPANSTSGNLIVVHLDWDKSTVHVSTVTDNKGNIYKKINGTTLWNAGAYAAELWYTYNIKVTPAGPITVTATLTGNTSTFFQIYTSEYSGIVSSIDPLDQNSVAIGGTVAVSSGNKTTAFSNELVYGASIGASATLAKGAGFNSRSVANSNIIEDKNVTATASYNAAFTSSAAGNWVAQMATFISTSSVLPITLSSFTGECSNNHIILAWTTASETNNDYFTIEQSSDGTNWHDIGTVKAMGNSAMSQNYSYTADATNSASYFRLQQTDLDGQFTYSKIVGVNSCSIGLSAVTIYPNPVSGSSLTGRIDIKPNENYWIDIFDNAGKMISHSAIQSPEFRVSFPHTLAAGIYYAKISSASAATVTAFMVK